jgi:hypothetical protein
MSEPRDPEPAPPSDQTPPDPEGDLTRPPEREAPGLTKTGAGETRHEPGREGGMIGEG